MPVPLPTSLPTTSELSKQFTCYQFSSGSPSSPCSSALFSRAENRPPGTLKRPDTTQAQQSKSKWHHRKAKPSLRLAFVAPIQIAKTLRRWRFVCRAAGYSQVFKTEKYSTIWRPSAHSHLVLMVSTEIWTRTPQDQHRWWRSGYTTGHYVKTRVAQGNTYGKKKIIKASTFAYNLYWSYTKRIPQVKKYIIYKTLSLRKALSSLS